MAVFLNRFLILSNKLAFLSAKNLKICFIIKSNCMFMANAVVFMSPKH